MAWFRTHFVFVFLTILSCHGCANGQISAIAYGIPQIISLLENVTDSSTAMASILPHMEGVLRNQVNLQNATNLFVNKSTESSDEILNDLLVKQQENNNETNGLLTEVINLLQNQRADNNGNQDTLNEIADSQNQIVTLLQSQHENQNKTVILLQEQQQTLTQLADTQAQTVTINTQMANVFDHVVALLQTQNQQLKNMTDGMTDVMDTVVSALGKHQETLENILDVQRQQIQNTTVSVEQQGYQPENLTTLTKQLDSQIQVLLLNQDKPRDCSHLAANGDYSTGPFHITTSDGLQLLGVYCDMDTDGGGWTVFHRRYDGSVGFRRPWIDYEQGFGSLDGEFWFGLRKIHQLTKSGQWMLRVDLQDFDGNTAYAEYDFFQVGDASSNYTLGIGLYQGTAGDSLRQQDLNNMQFSTYDRDNDEFSYSCASGNAGGWWYRSCSSVDLTGPYIGHSSTTLPVHSGMAWYYWKNSWETLKSSEMKIRRVH